MGNNKKNGLPENYILLGDSGTQTAKVHSIIFEGKKHHPEKFEGNRDCFEFELRYAAVFDKNFNELKRLQGTAAQVAGRRAEFKGYVIINMNEWLTHHDEDYLNKALLFMADMNDCWKYIFLIDNHNSKASKELTGKILSIFFRDHIICKVEESTEKCFDKNTVDLMCKEVGATCDVHVKEMVGKLLNQGFEDTVVSAFLSEASLYCGNKIDMKPFVDFITEGELSIRYMLSQKEYSRFMSIIEQKKEKRYDEKEAV